MCFLNLTRCLANIKAPYVSLILNQKVAKTHKLSHASSCCELSNSTGLSDPINDIVEWVLLLKSYFKREALSTYLEASWHHTCTGFWLLVIHLLCSVLGAFIPTASKPKGWRNNETEAGMELRRWKYLSHAGCRKPCQWKCANGASDT